MLSIYYYDLLAPCCNLWIQLLPSKPDAHNKKAAKKILFTIFDQLFSINCGHMSMYMLKSSETYEISLNVTIIIELFC